MRVFIVRQDVDGFQSLAPTDETVHKTDRLHFVTGTPKTPIWSPPEVYVPNPKLKRGNFMGFGGCGVFACDPVAAEVLSDMLNRSGELLPLPHEWRLYHVLNVTQMMDALDMEKSEFRHPAEKRGLSRPAFRPDRLVNAPPLFRIPQHYGIFTVQHTGDCEREFKARVESCGLRGLIFRELWDDAKGITLPPKVVI